MTTTYVALHRDIAREARTHRGQWILARFYTNPHWASAVARSICKGAMPSYADGTPYSAKHCLEAGKWALYVRSDLEEA